MSIANEPAFPSDDKIFASGLSKQAHSGLTKREYFAAKSMQWILSLPDFKAQMSRTLKRKPGIPQEIVAKAAVKYADALIKELEKETK